MSNAAGAAAHIRLIEELADRDTVLHRRHPATHLGVTLGYAVLVASFDKYALSALLPMILYPVFVLSLGEIPLSALLRRIVPVMPLLLAFGIFNPVFDRQVWILWDFPMSAGWLSMLSFLLRGILAVGVAVSLLAIIGTNGLSQALRTLRVPRLLIMQLLLTFRYLQVLAEEVQRMALAYHLRAPEQRGIAFQQWGSLAGQWLLRTLQRAQRLHQAMLCRGFRGDFPSAETPRFTIIDAGYLGGWIAFFILVRFVNLPLWLGSLFVH